MEEAFSLVGLTEDMGVNSVLFGFVGLCQMVFPTRLRACYLIGSHATGDAVADSDVDLLLVFKERFEAGERERLDHFRRSVGALARFPLDVNAVEEAGLMREGGVNLKRASLLVAGEDLRERVPLMPLEQWLRSSMHRPYVFMERARARVEGEPLRYPLGPPDPRGELLGYDHSAVVDAQGLPHRGFKELVTLASRLATADVALAGQHTFSKRDAIEAHRLHVNNERTLLFEQIHACRKRWGYRVPTAPEDQAHLRSLCARMPDAENHFLGLYRDYLLAELERGGVGERTLAARRLGEIVYPGPEVPAALARLEHDPDSTLRQCVRASLARYATRQGPSGA